MSQLDKGYQSDVVAQLLARVERLEAQMRKLQKQRAVPSNEAVAVATPSTNYGRWVDQCVQVLREDFERLMAPGATLEPVMRHVLSRILRDTDPPMRPCPKGVVLVYGRDDDGWTPLTTADVANIGNRLQIGLMQHLLEWKRAHASKLDGDMHLFHRFNRTASTLFSLSSDTVGHLRQHVYRTLNQLNSSLNA